MKKLMALLVGGLMITLFAPMASATFLGCGGSGNSGLLGPFTAATVGTAVCPTFLIPVGYTLTGIDLYINQNSSFGAQTGATATGVYTPSGANAGDTSFTQTLTETVGAFNNFNCVASGYDNGACPGTLTPTFSYSAGAGNFPPSGNIVIGYNLSYAGGGLASNGSTGIQIEIQYDYSNVVPEPATLALTGAGLLAFGFFARKRRNRTN